MRLHLISGKLSFFLADNKVAQYRELCFRVKVNAADNLKWTALHFACVRGQGDVVCKLLDAGAKLEAQSVIGATPLVEAVRNSRPKMVQLLLGRGANIGATTLSGTPTVITIYRWYQSVVVA